MQSALIGTIAVPGDKSISHRSIMFGAISNGETVINNFLESADCLTTMNAFRQLGVKIETVDNQVHVHGKGIDHLVAPSEPLNMGNSGTTTRLISGILASRPFETTLVGDASLSKRPMQRIIEPLTQMGAHFQSTDGHLPLTITGGQLTGIDYHMPIASAQVKSAIILAALSANQPTTIVEDTKSRDHTEAMLAQFSPQSITVHGNQIIIQPHHPLVGQTINVPGDISSAAFFLVAAAIIPESNITITNVGINPTRTGILSVLKRAGANINLTNQSQTGELSADISITATPLKPFTITAAEIPGLVDEVPLLALLAARANGISRITGAQELRLKESDRIKAITTEFKKLGIAIEELPDGFVIDGREPWHVVDPHLDSYHDHRIAMTLKIAALLVKTPVTINDEECINISYPTFNTDLAKLRS
ncbi:3-phosphoshikimate 1-carboxyvinyltransferase [Nicoliella lavandulae]|uniref:3-phosphoshikimate 1-carboxyvinyltransferase n=1 Tax=Nicoliella lavandulae TaxID=3082954 RepID=A0ABU8SMK2_9LACO